MGLLGGSFNPAHKGHLHISQEALKRLKLDEIWWIISPQNPLKNSGEIADYNLRKETAIMVAKDNRIKVSDIERNLGTTHTIDTLKALLKSYPDYKFVWMMGADNLRQIPKWKSWRGIFRLVPIAIFPRPSYSRRALSGKASRRFKKSRIRSARGSRLVNMRPPAWMFLHSQPDTTSATRIRETYSKPDSKPNWIN